MEINSILEKELKSCIKNKKVNWKKIRILSEKHNYRVDNEIFDYLREQEILTYRSSRTFGLLGCGVELNPHGGAHIGMYFKSKEDAFAFKKVWYSGAHYSVSVYQTVKRT